MGPSKRVDRARRRRRRRLAIPFVVTGAFALPACGGPGPAQVPATQSAGATDDQNQAAPDEPTESGVKPRAISNPPPPGTLPDAPTEGGTVMVNADGTCWWTIEVTCPPNTKCNPPPPRQVKCADKEPTAE